MTTATELTCAQVTAPPARTRHACLPSVAVCIPARNEAETVGRVVEVAVSSLRARSGRADEVVVVDDGSTDGTAAVAAAAGARVIRSAGAGKGEAMRRAVWDTSAELLVFLDADLTSLQADHIGKLTGPLVEDRARMLVKPRYRRDLFGRPGEGGRVSELVARPLLQLFWPELAEVDQPLAGEYALRRSALDAATLADGYAVDLALLIDVYVAFGRSAIAEADLGERTHRNRPLRDLTPQSKAIMAAVLCRTTP